MKRLLGILVLSFFLINFSSAATYNVAESLSDEKLDSIIRVKKDSLLEVLNDKIELSANFLKSNKGYINNMHDGLLLLMLNDHFKLGMSKLLPELEKEKKAYMRLYGKYFNNNKDYNFVQEEKADESDDSDEEGEVIISQGFIDALNNAYYRQLMVSFCENLPLHTAYLNYMLNRSAQSDTSLLQMYNMMAEYNQNKCADPEGVSKINQAKMNEDLKLLIAKKEVKVNSKVRALALLQYGGDADVKYVFKNASLLLDSQDKSGFWATDLNNTGDPDGSTTIYGLWALCAFREAMSAVK